MTAAPRVNVIDDDLEMRKSLHLLLQSVAIDVETYSNADDFLARFSALPERQDLLLLDVRMPGTSGTVLLERLRNEHPLLPVIMITGHGDIDMAVQAMKLGARDFITKPFSPQNLLDRIQEILRSTETSSIGADEAAARLATLTGREREIFWLLVSGTTNKAIGLELGISTRTVEAHRASIMEKTKARTLVDLVLLSVVLKQTRSGRI